jgi:hypothetical protein
MLPSSPLLGKRLLFHCDGNEEEEVVHEVVFAESNNTATNYEDRTAWPIVYGTRKSLHNNITDEPPACFQDKLETMVRNGDCMPACFAALLESLSKGKISRNPMQKAAAEMRNTVVAYIKKNWDTYPLFNESFKVHELIALTHDVPEERLGAASWGETADERFCEYEKRCKSIYFSDVEALLFSCMMNEKGVPLVFRMWRWNAETKTSVFLSCVPDDACLRSAGVTEAYVVDLEHSGDNDGRSAHYKIIEGGSLTGLLDLENKQKRRLIRTSDL